MAWPGDMQGRIDELEEQLAAAERRAHNWEVQAQLNAQARSATETEQVIARLKTTLADTQKGLDAEKGLNAMRKRRANTCQVCGTSRDITLSWTFDAWICDSCMDKQMDNFVLYRNMKEQLKTSNARIIELGKQFSVVNAALKGRDAELAEKELATADLEKKNGMLLAKLTIALNKNHGGGN